MGDAIVRQPDEWGQRNLTAAGLRVSSIICRLTSVGSLALRHLLCAHLPLAPQTLTHCAQHTRSVHLLRIGQLDWLEPKYCDLSDWLAGTSNLGSEEAANWSTGGSCRAGARLRTRRLAYSGAKLNSSRRPLALRHRRRSLVANLAPPAHCETNTCNPMIGLRPKTKQPNSG